MHAFKRNGFTLIELIIGIVMFAIALSIITALIAPQAQKSAEPIIALKAAKLGQSLMSEIQGKSFDEHSDRSPPFKRCGETTLGAELCTATDDLGVDNLSTGQQETRTSYNDVDDYIALSNLPITNSLGELLPQYSEFSLNVTVQYDSDFNEATNDEGTAFKRITIEITSSQGQVYGFSAYKGNY